MISLIEHVINQPVHYASIDGGHERNAINRYNDRRGRARCVAQLPFYCGKYLYCRKLLQCSMSRLQVQLPAISAFVIVPPHRTDAFHRTMEMRPRCTYLSRVSLQICAYRDQFVRQDETLRPTGLPPLPFVFRADYFRPLSPIRDERCFRLVRKQFLPISDAKLERVRNCVIRIDNCPTSRRSQHWQRKDLVTSQLITLLS